MRKIYSLFIAFLAFVFAANAKTTSIGLPPIFPHFGVPVSGSGTTRLIGYSYATYDGTRFVPHDSTTYSYSWGRGGLLNQEDMQDNFVNFDHSYTYLYVPGTGTYRNQFHRSQIFTTANKVQKYYCQSWNLSTNAWRDSAKFEYTYTGNSLLDETIFFIFKSGSWNQHVNYKNYYAANNSLGRMESTVFTMFFSYDGSGNMLSREDSVRGLSTPWHRQQKILFTYDASQRISNYVIQIEDNGSWKDDQKFEYSYIGNNISETIESGWNGTTWETTGKHIFTYDQNNNKLTDEYQRWNTTTSSFASESREQWTYTIQGQPLTYYSQTFEPSSGNWINIADDFFYRYYYESYSPTSTDDVTATIGVKLYPQPAQNTLNIEMESDQPTSYNAEVFDMRGTVIKTMSGRSNEGSSLNVSDLPNGNYFVRISTKQGQYSKQFMIAR